MAKFFNKIKVNSAVDARSNFDLSCDHVTTMDFFTPKISYFKEVIPGETTSINVESYIRLQPLTVPTFGRINLVHRAFFVPMRVIMKDWNQFITGLYNDLGYVRNEVPYILNSYLAKHIVNTFATQVEEGEPYDVQIRYDANDDRYYKLTTEGRTIVDRLNCLGIKLNWTYSDTTKISLLPIVAFAKIVEDWYSSNQLYPTTSVSTFVNKLFSASTSDITTLLNADDDSINDAFDDVIEMLGYQGAYEQDYFTSAWNNPSGPNKQLMGYDSMTIKNVDGDVMDYAVPSAQVNSTDPAAHLDVSSNDALTQFALDSLKKLSDYLKRHQLAGGKALDRYLARFGVQLTSEKLNRSNYLGRDIVPVKIGDIMSNADTDGATLGAYAGTGVAYGNNGKFTINSDNEYGYFIIVSQLVPRIGYVQGIDRNSLHVSREQFFTPEFDSLGTQAIATKELYSPMDFDKYNIATNGTNNKIFGYTPRYAEYKIGKDKLSGDYQFTSMNTGEDSWYTFRMFPWQNDDTDYLAGAMTSISTEFVEGTPVDRAQYNRIFNAGSDTYTADHFRCIFHFDVNASLPAKSLYDNYEFEDKGKEVTLQVNGTNVNGDN